MLQQSNKINFSMYNTQGTLVKRMHPDASSVVIVPSIALNLRRRVHPEISTCVTEVPNVTFITSSDLHFLRTSVRKFSKRHTNRVNLCDPVKSSLTSLGNSFGTICTGEYFTTHVLDMTKYNAVFAFVPVPVICHKLLGSCMSTSLESRDSTHSITVSEIILLNVMLTCLKVHNVLTSTRFAISIRMSKGIYRPDPIVAVFYERFTCSLF